MKHFAGGCFGFITALTSKDFSDIASIATGFGTFFYMVLCICKKLKSK